LFASTGIGLEPVPSMAMLAVTGAADMVSVFIRMSIVQHATPDGMRGRVSSVSFIFIAASNELGEFESGVAARVLGPVGAVILGGCVSLIAAASWFKLFPTLAHADRFEMAEREPSAAAQKPCALPAPALASASGQSRSRP